MKIDLYMDVEQWMDATWNFQAYAKPPVPKRPGQTRYKFTVEIADPKMADVDLGDVAAENVECES